MEACLLSAPTPSWSKCMLPSRGCHAKSLDDAKSTVLSKCSRRWVAQSGLGQKGSRTRSAAINCCLHPSKEDLQPQASRERSSDSGSVRSEKDSRRQFLAYTLALLVGSTALPGSSEAAGGLNKYIKRKKLDPLETYVPVVILSRDQLEELGRELISEDLDVLSARKLLRSGPASTLRNDMRAVAQYASDGGDGGRASTSAEQCLEGLSDVDSILLRISRGDSGASLNTAKDKLATAIAELDSVLATVPEPIFTKGKAVAAAYRESLSPESNGEGATPGIETAAEARDFI